MLLSVVNGCQYALAQLKQLQLNMLFLVCSEQVEHAEIGHASGTAAPVKSGVDSKPAARADLMDTLENELECVICREWMVAAYSFAPCGHSFCGNCLAGWLQSKDTCPCCRLASFSAWWLACLRLE